MSPVPTSPRSHTLFLSSCTFPLERRASMFLNIYVYGNLSCSTVQTVALPSKTDKMSPYPGKFHIIISFYISRYPQSAGRSTQGWYLPTFPHSVQLWRMWLQTEQQAVTAMHLPSQVQTVPYIHLLNLKLYSSTFKIHQWRLSSQRPKAAQIRNKDELYSRM